MRYLDHADRRIRRYIDGKERLIALLVEEKQAIINQAVTRGWTPTSPSNPPASSGWATCRPIGKFQEPKPISARWTNDLPTVQKSSCQSLT